MMLKSCLKVIAITLLLMFCHLHKQPGKSKNPRRASKRSWLQAVFCRKQQGPNPRQNPMRNIYRSQKPQIFLGNTFILGSEGARPIRANPALYGRFCAERQNQGCAWRSGKTGTAKHIHWAALEYGTTHQTRCVVLLFYVREHKWFSISIIIIIETI